MSFVAAAIGVSALIGAKSASDATNAQVGASRDANALQLEMFNRQREDQQPWRQAGIKALAGLDDGDFQRDFTAQDFQKDPGYDFRLQEGQNAINNAASARGMSNSGNTLKALTKYGQDYATGEYQNAYNRFNNDRNNRFNRLSSLAGVGQTANNQIGQAGMNYANNASQNILGAGNAQAAGSMAMGNSLNGAANSFMNYNLMSNYLTKKP